MIDFILSVIDLILYWLEGYSVLLTIAVPENKNFLLSKKEVVHTKKPKDMFPDMNFYIGLIIFIIIILIVVND